MPALTGAVNPISEQDLQDLDHLELDKENEDLTMAHGNSRKAASSPNKKLSKADKDRKRKERHAKVDAITDHTNEQQKVLKEASDKFKTTTRTKGRGKSGKDDDLVPLKINEWAKMCTNNHKLKDIVEETRDELEEVESNLEKLEEDHGKLETEYGKMEAAHERLKAEYNKAKQLMKANRGKKVSTKSTKDLQATDICEEITKVSKDVFRNIKLTQDTPSKKEATKRFWVKIKDVLGLEKPPRSLDFREFYRIYLP
ncbi:MAG: hypothetical protein AAF587_44955, partial [Bacteroidota bacterium]